MKVRRVVTGQDASGKSVFVSDEEVEPVTLELLPGAEFHRLWGADETSKLPTDATPTSQDRILSPGEWVPVGVLHPSTGGGGRAGEHQL